MEKNVLSHQYTDKAINKNKTNKILNNIYYNKEKQILTLIKHSSKMTIKCIKKTTQKVKSTRLYVVKRHVVKRHKSKDYSEVICTKKKIEGNVLKFPYHMCSENIMI